MSRLLKRVIIATLFLSLNGLVFGSIYWVFIRVAPTCFDGKQNQNELGVDCGGICPNVCFEKVVGKDLDTEKVVFVSGGGNQYDVVATVRNSNETLAASEFSYTFELKDREGRVLVARTGKSSVMPQSEKKLMELNLETTGTPASATLSVIDVIWKRSLDALEQPKVSIYQKRYAEVTAGFGFGKASGLLSNESPYDFRSITIYVTLYDGAGRVLALNRTTQNTIKSGESRDFDLVWPVAFSGVVDRVDMEVDADAYNPENLVKQNFPGGQY